MSFYVVTHRFNGSVYKVESSSKNKVKKSLPRWTDAGGYLVYFNVEEVTKEVYERVDAKHFWEVEA